MIYGTEAEGSLILAAADSAIEFEVLGSHLTLIDGEEKLHDGFRLPTVLEMLQDDHFIGFKKAPFVLTFVDDSRKVAFVERYGVSLIGRNQIRSKQEWMLREAIRRQYHPSAHPMLNGSDDPMAEPTEEQEKARGTTIGALYGIEGEDPWDKRSPEDKARMEAMKQKLKEAAEKGGMTGGSFEGDKAEAKDDGKGGLHVTGIKVHQDSAGALKVTQVEAFKDADPEAAPDSDDFTINHNGPAALFHRINVTGAKLADVQPILLDAGVDAPTLAVDRRNSSTGCWIAVLAQRHARRMTEALVAAGFVADNVTVNAAGATILPKGTEVVEEIDPAALNRPWNDKAAWAALSRDAKGEERKAMRGSEFIICGGAGGPQWGCNVWIAPRSWFAKTKTMFRSSLGIAALLPADLEEVAPGYYRTKNRDWLSVSQDLHRRGFRESLMLQVAVNNAS